MLKKIFGLFGNVKVVDLDNDGKIETLRAEVQGVFAHFVTMKEQLQEVNGRLRDVVKDELEKQKAEQERLERVAKEVNDKLQASQNRVEKAEAEIQANEGLEKKVSEFIL